ncbi:outer membrane protein assembly factor BamB family protein [Desulfolutivibrio sp.]|uniref:outer membrane protein assembly factor BamB family protein n=1 Tax=Desulfolutivibrio sp. TaxID=2773296 RepID=UPI002F96D2A6
MTRSLQFVILCVLLGCCPAILHAATGDLLWTGEMGGDKATWSTPVISGSLAIIKGQDGGLTALNAATGGQIWYNATIAASVSSPILQDGVLYLGADTHLYRINPATGEVLTDRALGGWFGCHAPAALAGRLYFARLVDITYSLVAVSAATLADIWSVPLGGSGAALTDGTYVYSLSTALKAHNPATGAELWSVSPPSGYTTFQEGAYNGGYLVAAVYSNMTGTTGLTGWYLGDGASAPSRLWTVSLGTSATADGIPPAIDGDKVYFATSDGFVRAYSLTSGASLWSLQVRTSGSAGPKPVALDGKVYIQEMLDAANNAVCLDGATGAVLWRASGTAGIVWGQAAVGGGRAYFAADWAGVFAFETAVHDDTWPMYKNNSGQTSASGDAPPAPTPGDPAARNLLLLQEP